MNILITGGAGFVGANFILESRNLKAKIEIIDNLFMVKNNLNIITKLNIKVHNQSILNYELLEKIFKEFKPTIIIHLAAIHFIPYCNLHPQQTLDVNTLGTYYITQLSCQFKVKQIIFASSASIYGDRRQLCKEDDLPMPKCIYGYSKFLAEQTITTLSKIPWTVLRFFNIYGPYETTDHLIFSIIEQLTQGNRSILLGNSESFRDYIHVLDVVEVVKRCILNDNVFNSILNVGTGVPTSGNQLIEFFQKNEAIPIKIIQSAKKIRKVDVPFLCADISKTKRVLKWKPSISLEEGLANLIKLGSLRCKHY